MKITACFISVFLLAILSNCSIDRSTDQASEQNFNQITSLPPTVQKVSTRIVTVIPSDTPLEPTTRSIQPTYTAMPETDQEGVYGPDLVYQGEVHEFSGEALQIVDRLFTDFGVTVVSPKEWNGTGNELWNINEIGAVAEAISQLPPQYFTNNKRFPKQILLIRTPNSFGQGGGGGYASRQMVLYTPTNFAPYENLHDEAGRLFGIQRDQLRAVVIHEWTHSFSEAHPELLEAWIAQTGWYRDSENIWKNEKPTFLIHDGNAHIDPNEDFATSASLFLLNPQVLSKERIQFFATSLSYNDWYAVPIVGQSK